MDRNKKFRLFSLASLCSIVALGVGWVVGFLVSGSPLAEVGAICGGWVGAIAGVELGYQQHCINAQWDRILWIGPMLGYFSAGGLAFYNQLPELLSAIISGIGAGFGALLAKYMMEFFNDEPPPSIL